MSLYVSSDNTPVKSLEPKKAALYYPHSIPKIANSKHFGNISYTFGNNPIEQTLRIFELKHEFNYTPLAMAIFKGTDDKYMIAYHANIYFSPILGGFSTTQYFDYWVDNEYFYIEYTHTRNGGAEDPDEINVTGKTYSFRFVVFAEGDDDEEIVKLQI